MGVVNAVKELIARDKDVEVYILSSVLSDSDYAIQEKNEWLDRYLPEIPRDKRLFPPCGEDKKTVVPKGVTETDFLLDDYTINLMQWEPPGQGVKLLNGINHTKGTWTGALASSKEERLLERLERTMNVERVAKEKEIAEKTVQTKPKVRGPRM